MNNIDLIITEHLIQMHKEAFNNYIQLQNEGNSQYPFLCQLSSRIEHLEKCLTSIAKSSKADESFYLKI